MKYHAQTFGTRDLTETEKCQLATAIETLGLIMELTGIRALVLEKQEAATPAAHIPANVEAN